MKLINKITKIDPETFAMEQILTIAVPIEMMQDNATRYKDDELAIIIGRSFISMLKS